MPPRNSADSSTQKKLQTSNATPTEKKKTKVVNLSLEEKNTTKDSRFRAHPTNKGKSYAMDLRIHSPSSIGFFSTGGIDTAAAFVRLAKIKGLEVIAITDHNNAEFIDIIKGYAIDSGITVIPGVDICCRIDLCYEAYMIALFPEHFSSSDVFQVMHQLGIPNWARGRHDFVIDLPFTEILNIIETNGGVLIPTRLDKTPYRQLALPTIIEQFGMHAFDLIHPENTDFFKKHWPNGRFTFFCFSNANSLAQVGNRIEKIRLSKPGFEGIKELVQRRIPTSS